MFAAPATIFTFSWGSVLSLIAPPSAQGANTSASILWSVSLSTAVAPYFETASSTRPLLMSETKILQPRWCSSLTSAMPTWPTPSTVTRSPLQSSRPSTCFAAASMPRATPYAVTGEGSPLFSFRPAAKRVCLRQCSMSSGLVPESSVVM